MNSKEYSKHLDRQAQKEKIKALAADDPMESRSHEEKAGALSQLAKHIANKFVTGRAFNAPMETTAIKTEGSIND